jgi:ankyrin repeat protein
MAAVGKQLSSLVHPDRAKRLMADLASGKLKPAADHILVEPSAAVVVPAVARPMEKPDWIPDNWDRPSSMSLGNHRLLDELLFRKIQGRRFHQDAIDRVVEAVEFGANIHLRFSEGMDALMFSLDRRFDVPDLRIVQYLLLKGADATVPTAGRTALDFAIDSQVYEAVVLLFSGISQHKPDVNAQDIEGVSPLMRAACYLDLNILEFLLQQGGDQFLKDRRGNNARNYALRSGNYAAFDLFAKYAPKTQPIDVQKGDIDES